MRKTTWGRKELVEATADLPKSNLRLVNTRVEMGLLVPDESSTEGKKRFDAKEALSFCIATTLEDMGFSPKHAYGHAKNIIVEYFLGIMTGEGIVSWLTVFYGQKQGVEFSVVLPNYKVEFGNEYLGQSKKDFVFFHVLEGVVLRMYRFQYDAIMNASQGIAQVKFINIDPTVNKYIHKLSFTGKDLRYLANFAIDFRSKQQHIVEGKSTKEKLMLTTSFDNQI